MAKTKSMMSAGARLGEGVRRKRNSTPRVEQTGVDSSVVKYHGIGNVVTTASSLGAAVFSRLYAPGDRTGLSLSVGPDVCGYYSTGKFMPGTSVRWEPNVSFTTSGRVFVGFTDNPEVIASISGLLNAYVATPGAGTYVPYADQVKAMGSVISFPIWQETNVPFPNRLRRKRFDVNETIVATDTNVLDRSVQVAMFVCIDGVQTGASVPTGSFWFHDVVNVEGLHGTLT